MQPNNNNSNSVLDAALALAHAYIPVFPVYGIVDGTCACGKQDCSSPGKHPAISKGFKAASMDPDQIKTWFADGTRNLGAVTGGHGSLAGLLVMDIDGPEGEISWERLVAGREIPVTRIVETGRGRHLWFSYRAVNAEGNTVKIRSAAGLEVKGTKYDHLDVRADDAYIIVPPSTHINGNTYRFANDNKVAEAPAWLLEALLSRETITRKSTSRANPATLAAGNADYKIYKPGRNVALTSIAGRLHKQALPEAGIKAMLLAINDERCEPPLPEKEVREIVASIMRYPAGEPSNAERQSASKKASPPFRLDAGACNDICAVTCTQTGERIWDYAVELYTAPNQLFVRAAVPAAQTASQLVTAIANRLAQEPRFAFGGDQRPYIWNGHKWESSRQLLCSWAFSLGRALSITVGEDVRDKGSIMQALWQAFKALRSPDGIAMTAFGTAPGIPVQDGVLVWNNCGWILQPANMAYSNLHVMGIGGQDALNALTDITENGVPTASMLGRFMTTSFAGEQPVMVRRWLGLHLVLHTIRNPEKFLYLFGHGGDGKGQFQRLIEALVSESATTWDSIDSLLPGSVMVENLVGKIAMLGAESKGRSSANMLKTLVSGEPVQCNPKYRAPFQVQTRLLITQASNAKPQLADRSDAIAQRMIYMEMLGGHRGSNHQVEDIAKVILESEYQLLMGLALQGATEIMQAGGRLVIPDSIRARSTDVARAADQVEAFLDNLEFGSFEIAIPELYAVYSRWCAEENGSAPMLKANFIGEIERIAKRDGHQVIEKRGAPYPASKWRDRHGNETPVCPALPNRPQMLWGVRVREDVYHSTPIGREGLPDGRKANSPVTSINQYRSAKQGAQVTELWEDAHDQNLEVDLFHSADPHSYR